MILSAALVLPRRSLTTVYIRHACVQWRHDTQRQQKIEMINILSLSLSLYTWFLTYRLWTKYCSRGALLQFVARWHMYDIECSICPAAKVTYYSLHSPCLCSMKTWHATPTKKLRWSALHMYIAYMKGTCVFPSTVSGPKIKIFLFAPTSRRMWNTWLVQVMKVGVPILFCDPLWGLEIEGTMHVRKHVLNVPQKKNPRGRGSIVSKYVQTHPVHRGKAMELPIWHFNEL